MRWFLVMAAMLIAAAVGCGKTGPEDKVTYVAKDDPRMKGAIDEARSSVKTFIAALESPKPTQTAFSVKTAIVDGENIEHIWLMPVTYDGKQFEGLINNEPNDVKNVHMGQTVTVEPSQVSDWMFVENGKLVGGYTLRVLRSSLSDSERADFDKSVPFTVE